MKAENCHAPSPSGPRDHPHLPILWLERHTMSKRVYRRSTQTHNDAFPQTHTCVTQTTHSLTATRSLTEIAVISTSVSLIFIPVWGFQIATSSFEILSQNDSDTFEQESSTQEWLCKTGKSNGAVVVRGCLCAALRCPPTNVHAHTNTHTLTFSGYLSRQVVVPLPVAKQLPSPLPLQHVHNVLFFPICVCVYVCACLCDLSLKQMQSTKCFLL